MCPNPGCEGRLRYRSTEAVETHGLDCGPFERWTDEWWECSSCGERFTGDELDRLCA